MSSGNFFAVDRRKWAQACSVGLNDAVVYLVQARGSGRDQSNTSWSVQAVETYTGISRSRAKAAIQSLQKADLTRLVKGGTHPRYEIRPWQEPRKKTASPPEWIFLPNTFVTGAADETPPLELLRQTQDSMTLRLAVDLYYAQNLAEDGGVSRGVTYQSYERYEVGRQSQYIVYGFRYPTLFVCWGETAKPHYRKLLTDDEKEAGKNGGIDFFVRMELQRDTGLIEWIPHLVEGEGAEAEVLHPLATNQADTSSIENRIGWAAHCAGLAMLTERQREWAEDEGLVLVPVPRHLVQVQVRGIARLRYRPQTSMTAAWWGELNAKGDQWAKSYEGLTAKLAPRPAALEA